MKRPKEVTIERIREISKYSNLTDEEAQAVLGTVRTYAQIIFDNMKRGKFKDIDLYTMKGDTLKDFIVQFYDKDRVSKVYKILVGIRAMEIEKS